MTTRRSIDLGWPAAGKPEPPPPENVLDFFAPPRLPFDIPPDVIILWAQGQQKRATEKAVARHERRREGFSKKESFR